MSTSSEYLNQAPNYDQTPIRGVARIVGVAREARQSNLAIRHKGLRRYREGLA